MHIADGVLSLEVCAATGALAIGAMALSVKRLDQSISTRTVPLTAMAAAMIFAGQMVKFPLVAVPAYGHLLGGVLAAVIVGPWAGCLALAMVLILQMALFADGGWLALGANVLNMGVVGSLGGYAIYAAVRRVIGGSRGVIAGAVVASWTSVVAASALFCGEFALSHRGGEFDLGTIISVMTSLHSLVGVGEALITGGIVGYVVAVRPDLIYTSEPTPGAALRLGRVLVSGVVVALAVAAFVAPFTSEGADALEATAEKTQFDALEVESRALVLEEYSVPLPGVDISAGFWQKISVSLAGVFGTVAVLGLSLGLGRLLPKGALADENAHAG
jgi:cobalt/nickel transport system permease protein